jgi:hypothetical protein
MNDFLLEYYLRNELEKIEEGLRANIQVVSVDRGIVCVTFTISDLLLGMRFLNTKCFIENDPKKTLDKLVRNIHERIKFERSKEL